MASSKIKGITIEIGGETTKLGKALEQAEKSSKSLQSELKGVNSLLKLDPGNVELLKQKQDLLTKSVEATEDKLKTLKSTMEKIKSGEIEVTEEQFRDLQREIVSTEQKLDSLKQQSKEFGSTFQQQMQVAGDNIKNLGGKVEAAGKKMSGLSTAAGAGLVASAKSAADNETAINKYIASTGKATSETEKYKDLMETIYKNNYGESIADVADKMRIVSNIMGDLPEKELQSVVEKSYMLQDAYDMDFQENIRGVNALMDQFGITSEQAYELINQGAQKGLNQNQDLTDQIAEYSTYYSKLGFTAEEFFNIMIAGAEDGAYQIDYLNDAMKEFGIRTKDNSKSTNDAYTALGLNVEEINNKFAQGGDKAQEAFAEVTKAIMEIEDPVKRNEIGVALFGTKFEDLEESAVFAMTSAKDQVNMLGNTVETTSETMYGGTSAKSQEAVRSIQQSFASLGEALLPIIAPIAEKIAELATKFSNLDPTIQKVILVVMGIVTALAPVLIIIGKVISAVGTIMPVVGKLGTLLAKAPVILGAIKGAIMAVVGALGWPVVAVTAIIGVIVLLWNKCEWFRNLVKGLWEGIKKGFEVAIEWIKGALVSIGEFFVNLWEGIKQVFAPVIDYYKMIFSAAWEGIKAIWNNVIGYFKAIWETIKGIFSVVKDVLTGNWQGAWEGIKGIVNTWINFFKGVWEGIKNVFKPVADWFTNIFSKAWNAVKDVFSTGGKIFDGIKDGIANVFKTVVNGIIGGINKVIAVPFNAINGMLNKIRNISFLNISPFKNLWKQNPLAVPQIPKLKTGTNFVPFDNMPAILHKGEKVVPAKYNPDIDNSHMKNALFDALTDFTNERVQNKNNQSSVNELTNLFKQYMPQILDNMSKDIVMDKKIVGKLVASEVNKELGVISAKEQRGY